MSHSFQTDIVPLFKDNSGGDNNRLSMKNNSSFYYDDKGEQKSVKDIQGRTFDGITYSGGAFDLYKHADVKSRAYRILLEVAAGNMPPHNPWGLDKVRTFAKWVDADCPETWD